METIDNIPGEIKKYNQWICWKTVERDGKPTKIPITITGENASATDSSTWASFEKAREYYENHHDEIGGIVKLPQARRPAA